MKIIPGREWIVWIVAIVGICLFILVLVHFFWCWRKSRMDSYTTTTSATTNGYYRILTATEGGNMINVWIDYKNLPYYSNSASSNIKSFTGVYQIGSGTTPVTAITFLSNITPIPSADFGSTPVAYMPIQNQSGTFCMPLIPFTDTTTLSTMSFGYQITFTDNTPTYSSLVSYANMSFLPMHIFDSTTASGDLPAVTLPSSALSVTIPTTPSTATLAQIQAAMNSGEALYMPEVVTTSDSTTFLSNLGSMIYINSNSTQDQKPDSAGMWFSATANGSPAYYSSSSTTPYILLTTKFDSYPVSGMVQTSSTPSYNISSTSSNSLSISFNSVPVHPTGLFPSQFQSPNYQVSAYCGPNPNSV
jgi:hypothetical protein